MSRQKGYEITCDRCGLKSFAPDDHPSLTIPIPENWRDVSDVNGQLCPNCSQQWEAVKKAFIECERYIILPPVKIHKEETQ